jgi:hypothetical protein
MEQYGSSWLAFREQLLPLTAEQMKRCRHCFDRNNEQLTDHPKEPVSTRLALGFES